MVGKPAEAGGNAIPGYSVIFGLQAIVDAPSVYFHGDGRHWFVTSHDVVPGPGAGDFVNQWDTPEQAAEDILDFYFGDGARMAAKRLSFAFPNAQS
jgi:hypothetical protein